MMSAQKKSWTAATACLILAAIALPSCESKAPGMKWSDIRGEWPDVEIKVYMPGTDSGTFDYFKEVVAGEGTIRSGSNVQTSEDDNVLVHGVSGDQGAIGFFGCAYYFENQDKLRSVPVVNPEMGKAVEPSPETIENGSYAPFSRPLFIYVNKGSIDDEPEVAAFVDFYLAYASQMAVEVDYVGLPEPIMDRVRTNVASRRTGTQFLTPEGEKVQGPLRAVYQATGAEGAPSEIEASWKTEAPLTGTVQIDGSSTVYPITEAVAEEFREHQPRVRVPVGVSGTGGGFKRFVKGETDISNASRPIKKAELEACRENGVELIEVPVAYDGLTIVVNPKNDWVKDITVEELRKIFVEPSQ